MRCTSRRVLVVAVIVAAAAVAGGGSGLVPLAPAYADGPPAADPPAPAAKSTRLALLPPPNDSSGIADDSGSANPASYAGDPRLMRMASPSPSRGLVYTGLDLGRKGTACDGVFEIRSRHGATLGCSHGPDPAPAGVDVRRGRSDEQIAADARAASGDGEPGSAAAPVGSVGCVGDGTSGSRVQAIYAVPADRTDRAATVIPVIRSAYAPRVDWQVSQSAAETGGEAHVIFVTEPAADGGACQLAVPVVHLSAAGDDSFSATVSELKAQGYNRADRKYLVWTDANVVCGVGSLYNDARPGQDNRNNGYAAMYARVDTGCWGHAEGHELMHTLGAVQDGAPHSSGGGHCTDEPDDLCYDDDGRGPATIFTACAGRNSALFDCNHDDYFYAGTPPLLNWLATHWNTYNSKWLLRGPLPAVTSGTIGSGSGGTGSGGGGSTAGSGVTGGTGGTIGIGPIVLPPIPPILNPAPAKASGYWMLTSDGRVHAFGAAPTLGEPYPIAGGVRAVDLEPTPSGSGYWVLDESGRVRGYGDAGGFGSVPSSLIGRGERAVSLSATPTGDGYWVFTSRGRAVPFGDAEFFGDVSDLVLNQPVIGSVSTPSGRGYWLFASDGGIFTFGDARFFGSTGALRLNRPVVAMAPAAGQGGYWLVAADGGLFAFGDAGFFGSMGAVRLNRPVTAVVPGEAGYLMVGEDGGAFSFGDVLFFGSLGANPPPTPVVSVALRV